MYKRQELSGLIKGIIESSLFNYNYPFTSDFQTKTVYNFYYICLLYTSDAADERSSVDLGGRRIIKKKNNYQ